MQLVAKPLFQKLETLEIMTFSTDEAIADILEEIEASYTRPSITNTEDSKLTMLFNDLAILQRNKLLIIQEYAPNTSSTSNRSVSKRLSQWLSSPRSSSGVA